MFIAPYFLSLFYPNIISRMIQPITKPPEKTITTAPIPAAPPGPPLPLLKKFNTCTRIKIAVMETIKDRQPETARPIPKNIISKKLAMTSSLCFFALHYTLEDM